MPSRVVLHVIAPGAVGGAETVVGSLASARHALVGSTHVATLGVTATNPLVLQLADEGVPVHQVSCGHRRYRCEIREVADIVADLGAEVVHTHVYRGDVAGYFAARRRRVPVVATYHGHCGGEWRNRFYEWLDRRILARFDAVACVSEDGASRLRRSGVPQRLLQVVPNGHRPPRLLDRAVARARLGLREGEFAVGWVGRLSREKGPDLLLAAMDSLRSDAVSAVLVGDGPGRPALEAQVRGRLNGRVQFAGGIPNAATLFGAFDALAITSRRDGLPMVLLEAMNAGVPVVAFRVGGIPEVLSEDSGWLVPPGRADAFAEAVREVVRDPAAAHRRAQAAQHLFRARFGEDQWVAAVERVYDRLLAPSDSRPK